MVSLSLVEALKVSKDAHCGPDYDTTCEGSRFGNCILYPFLLSHPSALGLLNFFILLHIIFLTLQPQAAHNMAIVDLNRSIAVLAARLDLEHATPYQNLLQN